MSDELGSKLDEMFQEKARRNAEAQATTNAEERARREFGESFEQVANTVIVPAIDRIAGHLQRHGIEAKRINKTENRKHEVGVWFRKAGSQHGPYAEVIYAADLWSKKISVRWQPHGKPNIGTTADEAIQIASITLDSVTAKLMDVIERQSF
jgi:hypothetical protein